MSRAKFDPFDEKMELKDGVGARSNGSKQLTRVGVSIFWLLVVVIVSARAIYFRPEMLDGIKRGAAFLGGY